MTAPRRNPADYAGELVCPRCGDGWPNCAEIDESGVLYTHAETCARYRWADDVCGTCDHAMKVHSIAY